MMISEVRAEGAMTGEQRMHAPPLNHALGPSAPPPLLSRRQSWILDGLLLACGLSWIVINLSVFVSDNAVELGFRRRAIVSAFSPQGWAFFTRDPRETWEKVFMVSQGQLEPENSADYRGAPWRGVRRSVRTRGMVLARISAAVPKDAWLDCKQSATACWQGFKGEATAVKLKLRDNTGLCGRLVLQQQQTLPWAWRRAYRKTQLPSRIAVINVDCVKA